MIEMTVTYKGLLRCKLIHWATVIFYSTKNNRTGKAFALADFSMETLGSHLVIIIGMKMEKLDFSLTNKRYLALHNRNTKTHKNIRFHC